MALPEKTNDTSAPASGGAEPEEEAPPKLKICYYCGKKVELSSACQTCGNYMLFQYNE